VEEYNKKTKELRFEAVSTYNRANQLFTAGNLVGARDAYRKAVRLDPYLWQAHYNLGMTVLKHVAKQSGSDEALWKYLELAPEAREEAEEAFREYLSLVPDTPSEREQIKRARSLLDKLERIW
jgi:tetratricopeptide (TPR) repeat protein